MKQKKDKNFELDSRRNRHFSETFKRAKVKDIVSKRISIRELCVLYEVSSTSVYRWLYLYSSVEKQANTVVQMESEYSKTEFYKNRVAELERLYGLKQMEVDFLNKGYEIASEDLGYDVKKKYAPQPLSGSESTEKNTPTR